MSNRILLVGAGHMGREYAKVLDKHSIEFICVTRSKKNIQAFHNETGKTAICGGITKEIVREFKPTHMINAVNIDQLQNSTLKAIEYGVKNILIEKPGGLTRQELLSLSEKCQETSCNLYIAYNRRYFGSTIKAREFIELDGGLTSVKIDFTELCGKINQNIYTKETLENWVIANSSHVIDLGLHFAGKVDDLSTITRGSLPWHPSGSIFCGFGVSQSGVPISFHSDWTSAGRWSLELMTPARKIILSPMEQVKTLEKDTLINKEYPLDPVDIDFRPGISRMIEDFVFGEASLACTVHEQLENFTNVYSRIYDR